MSIHSNLGFYAGMLVVVVNIANMIKETADRCPCTDKRSYFRKPDSCALALLEHWDHAWSPCNNGFHYRVDDLGVAMPNTACPCGKSFLDWLKVTDYGIRCLSSSACYRLVGLVVYMFVFGAVALAAPIEVSRLLIVIQSSISLSETGQIAFSPNWGTVFALCLVFGGELPVTLLENVGHGVARLLPGRAVRATGRHAPLNVADAQDRRARIAGARRQPRNRNGRFAVAVAPGED